MRPGVLRSKRWCATPSAEEHYAKERSPDQSDRAAPAQPGEDVSFVPAPKALADAGASGAVAATPAGANANAAALSVGNAVEGSGCAEATTPAMQPRPARTGSRPGPRRQASEKPAGAAEARPKVVKPLKPQTLQHTRLAEQQAGVANGARDRGGRRKRGERGGLLLFGQQELKVASAGE